jgi:hypothetical protein
VNNFKMLPPSSYRITESTLHENQSKLLGALTITAAQGLGGETFMVEGDKGVRQVRMARINDIVLLDHPPDAAGPRSINCYLVEAQDFTAAAPTGEGKKFKIDPQRLLYSLQWLHNSSPPDFHLQLVRDPAIWFEFVGTVLLGALKRHDPNLRAKLDGLSPG